jgi:starch synthase
MSHPASHNRRGKVLVSHPNTQYVHRLLLALLSGKRLGHFFTSLFYQPDRFLSGWYKYFPSFVKTKLEPLLRRRKFSGVPPEMITHFPLLEMTRELKKRLNPGADDQYYLEMAEAFDKKVSSHPALPDADVLVGYEMACEESFRKVRSRGGINILDLAQVHYRTIEEMALTFPGFRYLVADRPFFNRVNLRKQRELNLCDYIFCLSSFAAASLKKEGFPADKIFEVNLGYDPAVFYPKENYNTGSTFRLRYVGTLTRRKGLDQLLECYATLRERYPAIELTLVGPMGDASDLLKSSVIPFTHYPFTEPAELRRLYQEADLFVFPSYLDSWAMVVIEAMACGTPVIVTENTGASDAVRKGGGHIIETGNRQQLLDSIENLYSDRPALEKLGREAAATARAYTWENYYRQVNKALDHILEHENKRSV